MIEVEVFPDPDEVGTRAAELVGDDPSQGRGHAWSIGLGDQRG